MMIDVGQEMMIDVGLEMMIAEVQEMMIAEVQEIDMVQKKTSVRDFSVIAQSFVQKTLFMSKKCITIVDNLSPQDI